jgi:zona occludens toxin
MITLITGTPGSGKTLYAVWMLQKEVRAGRRLVVDGIRDLAIEHELVDEPWLRDWYARCQQNDVIVVDEVQRIWPPVSVSVKATEDIEKLHVHRHKGVDFVIITQHPQRLNKTIRDLVGRHVHVRRIFGMRQAVLYEWDHCHNPNSGFRDAVKTRWSYPKKVFELYTSAELHTKPKAVIPKALFVLPVALVAAGVLAWRGYGQVSGGFGSVGGAKASAVGGASGAAVSGAGGAKVGGGGAIDTASQKWRVAGEYVMDGRGYVLLVDALGRFRSELVGGFHGDTVRIEGAVDGEKVASWSGGGVIDAGARK